MNRFNPYLSCLLITTLAMVGGLHAQTRTQKIELMPVAQTADFAWTQLAEEPQGDVQTPRLPDAKALSYSYDKDTDILWFRLDLHQPLEREWFGINIAIDSDQDQTNGMNWWGLNQEFRFDRLVTVWVSDVGPYYQGTVGVADVEGLNRGSMDSLSSGDIRVALGEDDESVIIGVKRSLLDEDLSMDLIGTVGSTFMGNDDIPNTRWLSLDLAEAGS